MKGLLHAPSMWRTRASFFEAEHAFLLTHIAMRCLRCSCSQSIAGQMPPIMACSQLDPAVYGPNLGTVCPQNGESVCPQNGVGTVCPQNGESLCPQNGESVRPPHCRMPSAHDKFSPRSSMWAPHSARSSSSLFQGQEDPVPSCWCITPKKLAPQQRFLFCVYASYCRYPPLLLCARPCSACRCC
jgi:hypothetical protein